MTAAAHRKLPWQLRITAFDVESPVPGIEGREVGVLVPPGFNPRTRWPLPALYLLDGNNGLDFDPFGHGGWQAHLAADALAAAGAPFLLVLVPNTPARAEEFVPGMGRAPGPTAERHLEFLAQAVVPAVERRFPALVAPSGRVIAGSSYGGVHAFWAAWTRPELFGMALSMSPSRTYDLPGLVRKTKAHPQLRIYLDSGTTDHRGGDDGLARTRSLAKLLGSRGYGEKELRFVVGKGHNHTEAAWRERLPAAMRFLFLGR